MTDELNITVDAAYLPTDIYSKWSHFPLFPFQIQAIEKEKPYAMFVPTGFGKTFAGIIPSIIEDCHKTFFVFPSNALVETQFQSVRQRLVDWGVNFHLIKLTGDELLLSMLKEGFKTKGEALYNIITQHERNIIFTNIDIMFNIVAMRYSKKYTRDLASILKSARFIFDEFHFYKNITVLLMSVLYRILLKFSPHLAFFSATPTYSTLELLDAINSLERIELKEIPLESGVRITYPVDITIKLHSEDELNQACQWLKRNSAPNKLGMAVVNSIRDSMILYQMLKNEGLKVYLYNGMLKDNLPENISEGIIVGTSAIEVGIDKIVDFIYLEAENTVSFLQRFGRVGRHSAGTACAIVHPDIFNQLKTLSLSKTISRWEFINSLIQNEYRFNYLNLYSNSEFTSIIKNILALYNPDERLSSEQKDALRVLNVRDGVSAFILGKWSETPILIIYDILRAIRDYEVKQFYFGDNALKRVRELDKLSQARFEYYSQFIPPLILEVDGFTMPQKDRLSIKFKPPFIFYPNFPFLRSAFEQLYQKGLFTQTIIDRVIIEEGCVRIPDYSDRDKVWVWGYSSKLVKSCDGRGVFI
ncbi:MAG: type I-D CRISPR-associated helicase Cas3' [Candidatus Edwardsbacteria bacterium]